MAGSGTRIRAASEVGLTSSQRGPVDACRVRPDLDLTPLTPLLGSLLAESEAGLCDRELVDALRAISGATGVALWRELGDPGQDWRSVLEIGSAPALPAPEQVRAVLNGVLDGELGERARVLGPFWPTPCAQPASHSPGRGLAVSLGGPCDGDLELAEALLLLFARIEAVGGPLPSTDALPAALPYPPRVSDNEPSGGTGEPDPPA